jgi:Ca2+-binding RTX toxin-like protein
MTISGTSGDDNLTGTNSSDTFDLTQGGNDTVSGLGGNDKFDFGATLTAADRVDGGSGSDTVSLAGDYSAGLTLGASTLTSVETLAFSSGFTYAITTNDANVAAGQTLAIAAGSVNAGHTFTFDGSAETDGRFDVSANGEGVYSIKGGQGDDTIDMHATFNLARAESDFVDAGGGNDSVTVGGPSLFLSEHFTDEMLNGGSGTDTLTIDGLVGFFMSNFSAASSGFESIVSPVAQEGLIEGDDNANNFDFSGFKANSSANVNAEGGNDTLTAGKGVYDLSGGDGNDTIITAASGTQSLDGGAGDDLVIANLGARTKSDSFVGGPGTDTLDLNAGVTHGEFSNISGFEFINLAAGYNYNLNPTADTATTLVTIDGSALGADDHLVFDGTPNGTQGVFDVTGGAGRDIFTGGTGNDTLSGGGGNDKLYLAFGGADTVNGDDGNDVIYADSGLDSHGYTTADIIDGGAGHDTLAFTGDYSASGIHLGANVSNIELVDVSTEEIGATTVTTDDALVAAGQTLTVDARGMIPLSSFDGLIFDGSAETDGRFIIFGTRYNDHIDDGAGNDVIHLGGGVAGLGSDVVVSHGGNDTYISDGDTEFLMGATLNAADRISGMSSDDVVSLDGDYSAGVHFRDTTIQGITEIDLAAGHSYRLTTADANVGESQVLTVNATGLGTSDSLYFDGRAETDGSFDITGGAGTDTLLGGAKSDTIAGGDGGGTIYGGGDNDMLSGGAGADIFVYRAASESTGLGFDTISGFDGAMDSFDMPFRVRVLDPTIATGALSLTSFGSDLRDVVDAAHLGAHHAVLFTPDQGSFAGSTFLIVDGNGIAGFQTGLDYVIRLTDATNLDQLAAANFT